MEIGVQRQWPTVPWFTLVLWFSEPRFWEVDQMTRSMPQSNAEPQGPEAPVSEGPVLSSKGWKLCCLRVQSWAPRNGSSGIWGSSSEPQWLEAPVSEERKREYSSSWGDFFFCPLIFFFPIQALSRLDDDHTHGEGQLFLIHIAHWYKC